VPVDTVALCLAYLGATLGVAMVVPQLLRTVRHPRLEGVSPVAWGLTAVACLTWLTYGVRTATVPQIPGNVLLVSGAVAIVLLVPSQTSRRRRALVLAGAALAIVLLAFSVPAPFVGYLALGVGLVSAWPQVFDSFARWRAGGESGVSITTWSIKVVSQTCWLVYAVVTTQIPVVISAGVALTAALALVGLESSRRLAGSRRSSTAGALTAA
jgi:uncharacterized protein with PQ loop repeat